MFLAAMTAWSWVLNILFLCLGVVGLVKGADLFVGSASSLAKRFKISSLVIGLTVVAFGTSAPELAVSMVSAIKGESGLALGNVVGSNICNVALVLGLSALITPLTVKKSIVKRDFPFVIIASVVLLIFCLDNLLAGLPGIDNEIVRGEGLILVGGIVAFTMMSIANAKKDIAEGVTSEEEVEEVQDMPLKKSIPFLLIGLVLIVVGAEFVTTPASTIATEIGVMLGVNEEIMTTVVGLTVVAIGTSLPELVTSVIAAKKGENEIALGNVIGSNIFNILSVLGFSSVIKPLSATQDIITDLVFSILLIFMALGFSTRGKINRIQGGSLVFMYVIYLAYIVIRLFYPFLVLAV